MTPPDAFLFDMDGLLLDTERVYLREAVALLTPTGLDEQEVQAFFETMSGTSGARALGLLTDFLGDGDLAAAFNGKWHANVAAALSDGVALKRTVRATLAALASAGHRMAVVTSTHEAPARRHLQQAGLLAHFEVVTGGDQVSANKPDPAPYRETAAALGLDPARCAAFEDSDPGITAATQAGCRAVQVPDVRPAHAPLPDLGQQVASTVWEAVALFGVLPKDQTNAVAS